MGEEVTDPDCDIDRIRSNLGMVFQQFNLFPHINARCRTALSVRLVLKRPKEEAARRLKRICPRWVWPGGKRLSRSTFRRAAAAGRHRPPCRWTLA